MTRLSGWGRFPAVEAKVVTARTTADVARQIAAGPLIARGNGRAYGDSAVNADSTLAMRGMNRILRFDPDTGVLEAEAGVLLAEVIDAFLPRGWFPAVTPGTKFVTLGGAIAADVHGKNHHSEGSFGQFVDWLDVMGADGTITRCARNGNSDLFDWTIGGMGLTGVIVRCGVRLKPVKSAWVIQNTIVANGLDAAIAAFEDNLNAPYSVAWIDTLATGDALGRSIVMLGHHAARAELPPDKAARPFYTKRPGTKRLPFDLPGGLLNATTVRVMNAAFFWNEKRKPRRSIVDWDRYFYPLDAIQDWNRGYGRKGFMQFQCALPRASAALGLRDLLQAVAVSRQGSFLSVLKRFGPQGGRFSFPVEGYTLTMDFPVNDRSLTLMDTLDQIALAHGGRFYLAKDARLGAATLAKADPRAAEFATQRQAAGWADAFRSAQSERLGL